jgi:hypothetical protein
MLLGVFGLLSGSPASATAQTCITAPNGAMCTTVTGDGNHVSTIYSIYDKMVPTSVLGQVCNTRAWFFQIPPGGGVVDLGVETRDGCHLAGRTWLAKAFNRDFAPGSALCTKFYTDDWSDFIGQRCVGVS